MLPEFEWLGAGQSWRCAACTTDNRGAVARCYVCAAARSGVAAPTPRAHALLQSQAGPSGTAKVQRQFSAEDSENYYWMAAAAGCLGLCPAGVCVEGVSKPSAVVPDKLLAGQHWPRASRSSCTVRS